MQLFDFIVDCMAEFLKTRHLLHSRYKLPLGFTFSFPCEQRSLNQAHLTHWTKGFCCEGVEGVDVGRILQDAIERRHLPVDCMAVLNDTTGTLMSCAITETDCRVGAIFGAPAEASSLHFTTLHCDTCHLTGRLSYAPAQ